ncbi:MAG TPA: TIGR01777 family oxidoreductase, partial [Asanoa sp.]|nr:TIGR01777 family oxidoreductase [Asanoa sp.]
LRDSRVEPTRTLAEAIAKHSAPPATFISASGINIYGDTGDRVVDETDTPGEGFFPDLCRVWEAATRPAEEAGVRVVLLRSGVPLEKDEGFLKPQMLPFRLGIGGPIAGGRQWVPWISLDDWLSAVAFLLEERTDLAGPVNVTSPVPVTNAEFTKAFGAALHRPAVLPIPEFGVRVAVGGVAELAVMSTRAVPGVLGRAGFPFRHQDVRAALNDALVDR